MNRKFQTTTHLMKPHSQPPKRNDGDRSLMSEAEKTICLCVFGLFLLILTCVIIMINFFLVWKKSPNTKTKMTCFIFFHLMTAFVAVMIDLLDNILYFLFWLLLLLLWYGAIILRGNPNTEQMHIVDMNGMKFQLI